MPVYLTKRVRFCAGHRLHNPQFSDEKNREVFGPCSNPNGHGHNYELFVTVQGDPDPDTGMILNVYRLSHILHREILEDLDHKNLNVDVPWLHNMIPTMENVAVGIWERLERVIPKNMLHEIRLCESESNSVTYRGKGHEIPHLSPPRQRGGS
ncbi:MAG TPA: 6-carboxytetrahydropterin synthase [bacterium]|nr:6-carboxytetrahydropterin synthase [bacterium]HQQ00415.1 6-carboxytetrahydropterin synthase [bacterium]